MPVLKNAKHELFAQSLATGMPAIRAYAVTGYKPDRGVGNLPCHSRRVRSLLTDKKEHSVSDPLARLFREINSPKEADER